jgi:hypothetical protein
MSTTMTSAQAHARVELRALVDEYAWRTDQYDYEGWADLFTPDGVFTGQDHGAAEPFVRMAGRDQLVQVVHGNDQWVRTFHAIDSHVCTVDGDAATGVTYCTAHHLMTDDADAQSLVMLIRYHDEYARTDAGWRFRTRRLEVAWVEYVRADVRPLFAQVSGDFATEAG